MEIIQSIAGFFIAIGILVTFHEFGHFYVARLFNVKVLNFSIGFGKKIYTKKTTLDGTEYSIGLIPLGGYVKMLESRESEDPMDVGLLNQCFDKQSVYKKFLIVAAGPIFNLILAVIFFIFVHFSGIAGMKPYITSIDNHTLSSSAIDGKYEIIQVNNTPTKRWQDVRVEILNSVVNSDDLNLQIKSDLDNIENISVRYDKDILKKEGDIISNIGLNVKIPDLPATIGMVEKNSPASLAGLSIGDMEAFYCGNLGQANAMVGQRILQEIGQTGIPVVNCSNACATGATAFREAWTSIKAGLYDVVLAVGVEQMGTGLLGGAGGGAGIPKEGHCRR